jgi:hypothetical protein
MKSRQEARLTYYEGVRQGALDHFKATEEGPRKLEGVSPEKLDKLLADLRGKHKNLLKRIDRLIEKARLGDER